MDTIPPALRAALDAPALERRSWHWSIGPKYIGLFLWVAYFDSIGRRALPIGGLLPSVIGAAVGAFLAFALFYYLPAMWGQRTGRGLMPLASSTFGSKGVRWVPGLLDLCGQIVWMAVATSVATDLILQGLVWGRFLDSSLVYNARIELGPLYLKGGLFLVVSFFWMLWASLVGRYIVRVIGALMNIFPVFPAIMLALAVVLLLPNIGAFRGGGWDPDSMSDVSHGSRHAVMLVIQMVLGFFAVSALTAPDWGAVCRERRDVRDGGLVGIGFAAWIIATLSMLVVLSAAGKFEIRRAAIVGSGNLIVDESPLRYTFHHSVIEGIGGYWACAILLLMGLQSLAPTVFAAHIVGDRFESFSNGRIKPLAGILIAALIAWLLMSVSQLPLTWRLEPIFTIMGALYAPVLGALASDALRRRMEWPGPTRGWNFVGLAAWGVGVAVGLSPLVLDAFRNGPRSLSPQPAALFAFLAAFGVHAVLCRLRLEPAVIPVLSAHSETDGSRLGASADLL